MLYKTMFTEARINLQAGDLRIEQHVLHCYAAAQPQSMGNEIKSKNNAIAFAFHTPSRELRVI